MKPEINDALIDHLAQLARLEFSAAEKQEIKKDLEKMLAFVDKLEEVETEGIEPLVYINENGPTPRKDEAGPVLSQEEVLQNAPKRDSDYFKVPKVVEKK